MTGHIVVVSGPSGSGKTSLTKVICENNPMRYLSVSTTTRPPREGEVDGVDYNFVSKEEFLNEIGEGMFLEWAEVHGNFYGTSLRRVEEALKEGKTVLFDIDVQGHRSVREKYGSLVSSIFVTTPSLSILKERLKGRGTDSDEVIQKRIINALGEMEQLKMYDYILINETFQDSLVTMEAIVYACGYRQRLDDVGAFIKSWR